MGHFELYQRCTFARLLDLTTNDPEFDVKRCCQSLKKNNSGTIELSAVFAYRGAPTPAGQLIADQIGGWHSPERVGQHFKAILPAVNFYSKAEFSELLALWQLRHSIAHTGGYLTRADSQKVTKLRKHAGVIAFHENFSEALARRLHKLVKDSMSRLERAASNEFPQSLMDHDAANKLFAVKSPRDSWL